MAIVFLAIFTFALTGCSKGDDPEPGPTPTPTPTYYDMGVLDKTTGLRFKSYKVAGNTRSVNYADNGRINNFMYVDRISYIFSYDPNQITYVLDGDQRVSNVEYNEDGYLTHWRCSYSVSSDDGKIITYRENVSFSYSGGHLSNVTCRFTEENETSIKEEWKGNFTLTWRNNQLQSIVSVEEEQDVTETNTITFTYSNNSYKNVYRQWIPDLCSYFEIPDQIAFVGLLGPWSDMLPTSVVYSYSSTESYTFEYGFNSDGSISYIDRTGSWRHDFSYDYAKR